MIEISEKKINKTEICKLDLPKWRETNQRLLPPFVDVSGVQELKYNPITFHSISGPIFNGYCTLAEWVIAQKSVLIEGYGGVFFDEIKEKIEAEFQLKGITAKWHLTSDYFKSDMEIDSIIKPFLGNEEDVWGHKCDLQMRDFMQQEKFFEICKDPLVDVNIVIGVGAGLVGWTSPIIYFDLPKNEIQYRMRAKSVKNLGAKKAKSPFSMYKRFYFVDWVVLNNYQRTLLNRIEIVADGQWVNDVNWLFKKDLKHGLKHLSETVFRVRPWFEPGSWGGQWSKKHLDKLEQSEVNYAWSFELITPENGLVLENNGFIVEVSFDFFMGWENENILGVHAVQFGTYFPIRFDFLDTFDGNNLSIQCHPSKAYIQKEFGEIITQDETYYILDCKDDAKVYLGFQENINPEAFKKELEESQRNNQEIDIEDYVQILPSHKHDLFLIPNGTVHSAGKNNMVLEISATPYIFTFKMYDWLSFDLNGKPRPINIEHAFNNLRFERKGDLVKTELISHPLLIAHGDKWELIHLPTHEEHFYDVHRMEFENEISVQTENRCHVMMLVEGESVTIEIGGKRLNKFNFAETFIIPAAANEYKLINSGKSKAKVIKAFLK